MTDALKVGVDVPAARFCDGKCTFLVLFQVPGTPILPKICRELGGHLGNTTDQVLSQGEATDQLFEKGVVGLPQKVVGRPLSPNPGQFGLFILFSLNTLGHTLFPLNSNSEISPSPFLEHSPSQICALYVFSYAPRKLFSQNFSVFIILDPD